MPQSLHDLFLNDLLKLSTPGPGAAARGVRLVARFQSDVMLSGIAPGRVLVFIPDLHLLTKATSAKYRYDFTKSDHTHPVRREELLAAVLDTIESFARSIQTDIFQLGDFIDLWREGQYVDDLNGSSQREFVTKTVDTVLRDYGSTIGPGISKFGQGLPNYHIVAGNHDLELALSPRFANAQRALAPAVGSDGKRSALVLHGDLFDRFERVTSDKLAGHLLYLFGKNVSAHSYDIKARETDPADWISAPARIESAGQIAGLLKRVNVMYCPVRATTAQTKKVHELLVGADGEKKNPDAPGKFVSDTGALPSFDDLKAGFENPANSQIFKATGSTALPDLQLIVVGHSHKPRIVTVGRPHEHGSFVLMDCGAWIEQIKWSFERDDARNGILDSCQIGVASDREIRIYQLDPLPA